MKDIDANLVIKHLLGENKQKAYEIALLKAQLESTQEQLLNEVRKDDKNDTQ